MNALARSGALLTSSYGVTHPSEPNYLALFSGSTHGISNDSCPHTWSGNNLGHQLLTTGLTFAGYAQSLPRTGYSGCDYSDYARKHAPWINFSDLPASVHKPMTAFPSDFTKLPTVSFVVPDLQHDMHDGTVHQADTWLSANLSRYVTWARTHNSLLILTWDEDDDSAGNHIPGVIVGAHVKPGSYAQRVDHYRMLRTIEAAYGLAPLGAAAARQPITGIWTG
jgi:acid phosphatase